MSGGATEILSHLTERARLRWLHAKELAAGCIYSASECDALLRELETTGAPPSLVHKVALTLITQSTLVSRLGLDWTTVYWVSDRLRDSFGRPRAPPG